MTREADETFAMLVDYLLGVSLRYATRKIQVNWGTDADVKPMPATVLYVVGFLLGKEPEQFATPKSVGIRL